MVLINLVKALIWTLIIAVFAWVFGGAFYLQHFLMAAGLVFCGMMGSDFAELALIKWFNRSENA